MTDDTKDKPEDEPGPGRTDDQGVAEPATDDDAASVLFFGDHLENIVKQQQARLAVAERGEGGEGSDGGEGGENREEPENPSALSPSLLFFGESLEKAAEAEEESEARAAAADEEDER